LPFCRRSNDRELESCILESKGDARWRLVIAADPFTNSRLKEIADQATKAAMPSIFVNPEFVAVGGLMSYGGNIIETHYLAGSYVGRILKGEKSGELPVIQGTKSRVNREPPNREDVGH